MRLLGSFSPSPIFAAELDLDRGERRQLADTFHRQSRIDLDRMSSSDPCNWAMGLHSLHGAAANLGMARVEFCCRVAEHLPRSLDFTRPILRYWIGREVEASFAQMASVGGEDKASKGAD